jgi:hypothetical protein
VGFITKLVTDLAAGTPSKIILQACIISGRFPHPDNLREWAGQAAKTGASHIEWYTAGAPRFIWRDGYREMLRVSRLWRDLPQLDIPSSSAIGVIFSDDARLGADDAALHPHYVMHALLGENLGAWYTFIGENQVRKGQQSLDGKRILIAPVLSFVSSEFSGMLLDAVHGGATLVLLDPDAFRYDIETGPMDSVRILVTGSRIGETRDVVSISPTPEGKKRFSGIDRLPVGQPKKGFPARTVIPPVDARVLFAYDDGKPAVYSRRIGDGEIIVFAVQPFGDSEAAVESGGWDTFFASLIDEAGIERGLPLWRFELPVTGGEIETSLPICLGGKR